MESMTESEFAKAGRKWPEDDRLRRMEKHNESAARSRRKHVVRDRTKHANRNREFYESHPNWMKEYRSAHKEDINESKKRYKKTEKGKAGNQRYKAKRRSREEGTLNTLTFSEWTGILRRYDYRCAYCGAEADTDNFLERDHVTPVSKGGDNTKENIVPSCRLCNARKGDKIL